MAGEGDYLEWGSSVVSGLALFISLFAWRASQEANRIGIFKERFDVYRAAGEFIQGWNQLGRPDMTRLSVLVGAWNRSHFLFSPAVTEHLREIWVDAVRADFASKVLSGDAVGDRDQELKLHLNLLQKHSEFDRLRDAFREMSIR